MWRGEKMGQLRGRIEEKRLRGWGEEGREVERA